MNQICNQPDKIRKTDIIIVIQPIEGKNALSNKGLVDNRLFTGENRLHAVMNTQTCLWHLKYDSGIVPPALQQQFTGFTRLLNFVKDYFKKRNIEIKEIID